jgi:hypothetical protein
MQNPSSSSDSLKYSPLRFGRRGCLGGLPPAPGGGGSPEWIGVTVALKAAPPATAIRVVAQHEIDRYRNYIEHRSAKPYEQ